MSLAIVLTKQDAASPTHVVLAVGSWPVIAVSSGTTHSPLVIVSCWGVNGCIFFVIVIIVVPIKGGSFPATISTYWLFLVIVLFSIKSGRIFLLSLFFIIQKTSRVFFLACRIHGTIMKPAMNTRNGAALRTHAIGAPCHRLSGTSGTLANHGGATTACIAILIVRIFFLPVA